MRNRRTYFDYNASAPLGSEARAAMIHALDLVGNASSVHGEGRQLRALVEEAREDVAAVVGARPSEVVFTAGATEANNWVLAAGWDTVFASEIEHESVLAPSSIGAGDLVTFAADGNGLAHVGEIGERILCQDGDVGRALVSLQLANNETGVVQPVGEVAEFCREHGLACHSDATQAVGRMAIDFAGLGLDYLSMSGHKIGAPKGVGALVIRNGNEIPAFVRGGGQERRRRAGTENVPAIAGLGAAARAALIELQSMARVAALRDRLERGVCEITPSAMIIGRRVERIANTSCIAVPGQSSTTLVIKLDLEGIAVGAGSACSSGKIGGSHVMHAMGFDSEIGESAIRVSIGCGTTGDDVDQFLAAWSKIHAEARDVETIGLTVVGAVMEDVKAGE